MAESRTGTCGVALCPKCGTETQIKVCIGNASKEPVLSHGHFEFECMECKTYWVIYVQFIEKG